MKNDTILLDDIGIAVLSTDRPHCLLSFLNSVEQNSNKTKVIVIDDSKNCDKTHEVSNRFNFTTFIHTGNRLGIAKNTNHALDALSKFEYKIIFNNDVIIKKQGWEFLYPLSIKKTGIHCFSYRQLGLWGACKDGGSGKRPDKRWVHKSEDGSCTTIATVEEQPQGAIIAFDKLAFETVGYYDIKFESYGYSHHFWCKMIGMSGIQPEGYHDLPYSNEYFEVKDEPCTTPTGERIKYYAINKEIFKQEVAKVKSKVRGYYTPKKTIP